MACLYSCLMNKSCNIYCQSQVPQGTPVIPGAQEAEAGELQVQGQNGNHSETLSQNKAVKIYNINIFSKVTVNSICSTLNKIVPYLHQHVVFSVFSTLAILVDV